MMLQERFGVGLIICSSLRENPLSLKTLEAAHRHHCV